MTINEVFIIKPPARLSVFALRRVIPPGQYPTLENTLNVKGRNYLHCFWVDGVVGEDT
jgi:hypothetical protein